MRERIKAFSRILEQAIENKQVEIFCKVTALIFIIVCIILTIINGEFFSNTFIVCITLIMALYILPKGLYELISRLSDLLSTLSDLI